MRFVERGSNAAAAFTLAQEIPRVTPLDLSPQFASNVYIPINLRNRSLIETTSKDYINRILPFVSVGIAVAGAVGLAVATEMIPQGGFFLMVTVGILSLVGFFVGPSLPLFLRLFITFATFYFGYCACLLGRTTSPHLNRDNLQWALYAFFLLGTIPTLSLIRLWKQKIRIAVVASVLPISLLTALAVAHYEEWKFIKDHPHGIGPTPRWTVSNHWLAYDAANHVLSGSD